MTAKNYALIEDGSVKTIIWCNEENAYEFPAAVCVADRPVAKGDAYDKGVFLRAETVVKTYAEELAIALAAEAALSQE